ncbi:protein AATF-like isoform X2 [Oratosquilla oratoria]
MDSDLMKYYLAPDDSDNEGDDTDNEGDDDDDSGEDSDSEGEKQDDDAESSSEVGNEEEECNNEMRGPTSSEGRHGKDYVSESGEDTDVSDDEDEDEDNDVIQQMKGQLEGSDSDGSIDDEDYSRYADKDYEDDDDDEDEENEEKNSESEQASGGIKKFSDHNTSEEILKGQAIQSQLGLHDSLFECRISLQKVLQSANQLPQHDTYNAFLKLKDAEYTNNLTSSRSACKKLLTTLLDLQESFMKSLKIQQASGKKLVKGHNSSDEEITSSEDEEEKVPSSEAQSQGQKRKFSLEDYEDVLAKRQATLLPFRDETITQWYEKTKLLSSQKGSNKFSGFEMSALQQLQNILLNKEKLVQRTQLVGTMRGNTQRVLGTKIEDTEVNAETYDPEIFDDTDFYTRSLEEVLKSKVSSSEDMNVVSRKWVQIQNMRRKAKKRVDTKASKGRKIRYEVFSKLQQYLASSHQPVMEDGAISLLFGSLFGKSLEKVKSGTIS